MLLFVALAAHAGDFVHGYAKAAAGVPAHGDVLPTATSRLQLDLGERVDRLSWRAAVDLDLDLGAIADHSDPQAGLSLLPVELKVATHQSFYDLSQRK